VLLTANAKAWLAPLGEPGGPFHRLSAHGQFRRGFVEVVWMRAGPFVSRATALFARAPVRELRVVSTTLGELAAVADSPFFPRLGALDLSDRRLGDAAADVLARRSAARLTTLRLRGCALTDAAAYRLAAVPFAWPLEEMDVTFNPIGETGLNALRDRFGGAVVASPPAG
jgi:hypothetical protein